MGGTLVAPQDFLAWKILGYRLAHGIKRIVSGKIWRVGVHEVQVEEEARTRVHADPGAHILDHFARLDEL